MSSPKNRRRRLVICVVRAILGNKCNTLRPAARARAMRCMYISVFPLDVTPWSRQMSLVENDAAMALYADCCAFERDCGGMHAERVLFSRVMSTFMT